MGAACVVPGVSIGSDHSWPGRFGTHLVVLGKMAVFWLVFFFQAEDGIRDLVRSRGLGDVYKRQAARARIPTAAGRTSGRAAPARPCPPAARR